MIDPLAILGGLALDLGVALIAGVLIVGLEFATAARRGEIEPLLHDDPAAERKFFHRLRDDFFFQSGTLLISLLTAVLAGYYTARWAQSAPLVNAGLMGALSVVITWLVDWRDITPPWAMWTWTVFGVPAALFGGWMFCCGVSG